MEYLLSVFLFIILLIATCIYSFGPALSIIALIISAACLAMYIYMHRKNAKVPERFSESKIRTTLTVSIVCFSTAAILIVLRIALNMLDKALSQGMTYM